MIYVWHTDYTIFLTHANSIDEAKENLKKQRKGINTTWQRGSEIDANESDLLEAFEEEPLTFPDGSTIILEHGNE
jgi:hypothetical protein